MRNILRIAGFSFLFAVAIVTAAPLTEKDARKMTSEELVTYFHENQENKDWMETFQNVEVTQDKALILKVSEAAVMVINTMPPMEAAEKVSSLNLKVENVQIVKSADASKPYEIKLMDASGAAKGKEEVTENTQAVQTQKKEETAEKAKAEAAKDDQTTEETAQTTDNQAGQGNQAAVTIEAVAPAPAVEDRVDNTPINQGQTYEEQNTVTRNKQIVPVNPISESSNKL